MKRNNTLGRLLSLAGCLSLPMGTSAQTPAVRPDSAKAAGLFSSDAPLSFTLTGPMQTIVADRTKPKADSLATKHPARLTYQPADGDVQEWPIALLVRGNFRRNAVNCAFPPLYVDFPKKKVKNTLFTGQNRLKLVTHCQSEEYVPREFLVYKVYNLLTPYSFRARLARVTYADSAGKRNAETRWGFLIEDEDDLAKRNRLREAKTTLQGSEIDSLNLATMAVFEFMIGNIDWSIPYRHNVRVLANTNDDVLPKVVPYDFDHSVLVDAPYASLPDDDGRLYRGNLYPGWLMKRVFARFNELKPQIYTLYESDRRLTRAYVKQALKHFDKFYAVINDPKQVKAYFFNGDAGGKQFASFK